MFVKILYKSGLETIHECISSSWNPLPFMDDPECHKVIINIVGRDGTQISPEYDCTKLLGVYYMSDEGKTIDHKQW